MSLFKKARVQDRKFRAAIMGVSNSGKTYTALVLASVLGKKIALIDTEHSSASMYADNFNFDSLNLDSFHPSKYIEAIQAAVK
jgi:type II secretory pathway predicted ATPase ExeA